ncbi:MAG: hypothetical protein M3O33_13355 [Cyanobacteriota bacterium]|nr:hypothetical protein [Cyanobacteriota bacterium]
MAVAITSCNTVTTNQYEATAQTTLTWQVKYSINPTNDKLPRFEEFASTSLLSRNGEQPKDAVIGPDEKGLWWPALPPRPSIDEVEQRQQPQEKASKPELLRTANYQITYKQDGQTVTLPTNYDVYRQVARAYRSQKPLQLTLGIGDRSVEKAELSTK